MKLAILIPTLTSRRELLTRVYDELLKQIRETRNMFEVGIFLEEDQAQLTTGLKRNLLIQSAVKAGAQYVSFVDDDDMVGPTYIKRGIEVVDSGWDCGELWGQIYWSGVKGKPFHHSIEHAEWYENDKTYFRMPNHLNFQKLSLVKDIPFPDQSFGEDGQQSYAMRDAKIFKTQYPIPEVIYHYYNGNPKHAL